MGNKIAEILLDQVGHGKLEFTQWISIMLLHGAAMSGGGMRKASGKTCSEKGEE